MTATEETESDPRRYSSPARFLFMPARRAFLETNEQFRLRGGIVRLALDVARYTSSLLTLAHWVSALLLVAFIYFSGRLLGALPSAAAGGWQSPSGHTVVVYLVAAGLCFLGTQVLGPVRTGLEGLVIRQVDGAVRDRLAASSVTTAGVAPLEDQELLRELTMAKDGLEEGNHTPGAAVTGLAKLSGLYAQAFLAALLIAILVSPFIAAGLLGGGLLIRRAHRIGLVRESDLRSENYDLVRKAAYYRHVGLDGAAGREIRIFALASWLTARFRTLSLSSLEATLKVRRTVHGNRFIPPVVAATVAAALSLLWIVHRAVTGDVTIMHLVICLQAGYVCLQIGNYFVEDWQTQWGLQAHRALRRFDRAMVARAEIDLGRRWQGAGDPAEMPRDSLCFQSVSFHYPGGTEPVLDRLSLDIPVGRSLGIVGLNGAGKTTLVKLLAGLYEPSSGAIAVDGTDLRLLDLRAWQRNVAAIFQDFVRYQFTAGENIAFADAACAENLEDIRWAAGKAGILDVLERLPKGLDTPLSSSYRDGADLSGGQWQRLALARAFYAVRRGARILILDEPTASLDIRAEAAFLDQFIDLARGITTIVISHRFATVRRADRIVVLENGAIVEQGTHRSLLATEGRYRRLFQLQAERFAETGADGDADGGKEAGAAG